MFIFFDFCLLLLLSVLQGKGYAEKNALKNMQGRDGAALPGVLCDFDGMRIKNTPYLLLFSAEKRGPGITCPVSERGTGVSR